ncbi:MAG: cytochrome c [Thermoanaerobaculia bacterium]
MSWSTEFFAALGRLASVGSRGILALAATLSTLAIAGCGPPTSGKTAVALYTENCARCHGADGRGDPRQVGLAPASDLSRSALIRAQARGPIYLRITQGYGSMPAFSYKLERGDIELLVDYVMAIPGR